MSTTKEPHLFRTSGPESNSDPETHTVQRPNQDAQTDFSEGTSSAVLQADLTQVFQGDPKGNQERVKYVRPIGQPQ